MRIIDWSTDVCSYDLPDHWPGQLYRCVPRPWPVSRQPSRACRKAGWSGACGAVVLAAAQTQRAVRRARLDRTDAADQRSEEHTSELQSLMRKSYAVFCLKKNKPSYHFNNRLLLHRIRYHKYNIYKSYNQC